MRKSVLATSTAVVLMLAGCGGVATNDDSKSAADCGKELKIGAPYPLSGVWAENGQNSLQGMEIAAAEINAAGGIKNLNGANVEIASADTTSDQPAQAKTVTEGLLQGDGVVAIVGSYLSSMTLTTVVATENAKIPLITQSFVDELTQKGYKYLFQIAPKASSFGDRTVEGAMGIFKSAGKTLKKIVIAGADDASSKAQGEAVQSAAKAKSLEVADNITFPNGLSDAQPIIGKLTSANADLIVLGGNLSDLSLIINGIRATGMTTPIATSGGGGSLTPQFTKVLGPNAEGVIATAAWNADLDLPGLDNASAEYEKQHGQFMPQEAGESWAAVHQLAQVMDDQKSCDPEKIAEGLRSTTFDKGPASAVPPGKVAYDKSGANKYIEPILVQWQGGELKTVFPEDLKTTDATLN